MGSYKGFISPLILLETHLELPMTFKYGFPSKEASNAWRGTGLLEVLQACDGALPEEDPVSSKKPLGRRAPVKTLDELVFFEIGF